MRDKKRIKISKLNVIFLWLNHASTSGITEALWTGKGERTLANGDFCGREKMTTSTEKVLQ